MSESNARSDFFRSEKIVLCPDGFVRATESVLGDIQFEHFLSGLDDQIPEGLAEGAFATTISGYTEWLSVTEPVISIGWDWYMEVIEGLPTYIRAGEPRSNLMLVDEHLSEDLGSKKTSACIEAMLQGFNWEMIAINHIHIKYS